MSYDIEELQKRKRTYEDYMKSSQYLQKAEADAKAAQAAAIYDANNAYARQKATYGTRAENLSAMGLTGGGYSDYLEAQAYAQQRADTAAASAQYASAMRNARYVDYENWKAEQDKIDSDIKTLTAEKKADEATERTNYLNLLGLVKEGAITGDEVGQIAGKYGIEGTDLDLLNTAAQKLKIEQDLENFIANGYRESDIPLLDNGSPDTSSAIYKEYNKQIAEFVTDGMYDNAKDYNDAQKILTDIENNKFVDETIKTKARDIFNATYQSNGNPDGIPNKRYSNATVTGFKGSPGENFKITVGNNDYKVRLGNETIKSDQLTKWFGDISNNSVVSFDGNVYIYSNGKWYNIDDRSAKSKAGEIYRLARAPH